MASVLLQISGLVKRPLSLGWDELEQLPEAARVADVSRIIPGRQGAGVSLDALLERAEPLPAADFATLHADRDDFHVSVPLALLKGQGIVVYRLGEAPLGTEKGGPIRLLIRDPLACQTGELDDCANVKYLSRIELGQGRGRDTRPTNESEHAALHEGAGPASGTR